MKYYQPCNCHVVFIYLSLLSLAFTNCICNLVSLQIVAKNLESILIRSLIGLYIISIYKACIGCYGLNNIVIISVFRYRSPGYPHSLADLSSS